MKRLFDAPYIQIFDATEPRVDSSGTKYTFSAQDMKDVAETYDPANFKAPLIISHETTDAKEEVVGDADIVKREELAFGYPDKVVAIGKKLYGLFTEEASKLNRRIISLFREGKLLGVSASFYGAKNPNNPYQGKLALRHIAALGASPPAVKGMEDPALTLAFQELFEAEDEAISFNESSVGAGEIAETLQSPEFEAKDEQESTDKLPPTTATEPVEHSADEEAANPTSFEEGMDKTTVAKVRKHSKEGKTAAEIAKALGLEQGDVTEVLGGDMGEDKQDEPEMMDKDKDKKDYSESEVDALRAELEAAKAQLTAKNAEAKNVQLEAEAKFKERIEVAEKQAKQAEKQAKQAAEFAEAQAKKLRNNSISSFVESLTAGDEPRLLKANAKNKVDIATASDIEFAEGDSKEPMTLVEFMERLDAPGEAFMRNFLGTLPVHSEFTEIDAQNYEQQKPASLSGFSKADMEQMSESDRKVLAYCEKEGKDYFELPNHELNRLYEEVA